MKRDLRVQWQMFLGIAAFITVIDIVYWFASYERAGTTMLTLAAGLAALCGGWLLIQDLRGRGDDDDSSGGPAIDHVPRDASGRETVGEYLPTTSWWPLVIGVGLVLAVNGLILSWPFAIPGVVVVMLGIGGFVTDSRRRARDRGANLIVLAAAIGLAYAGGIRSLRRRGRGWPLRRSLCAAGAVTAIAAADLTPGASFSGHMLEHILLGMLAPLLLALSAPVTLALQTTPPWLRPGIRRSVHSGPARLLSHPLVGLAIFGASLTVLYFTPLLELSVRNAPVHVAVHAHLIAAGALFMWPIIGVDPIPRRVPFGARILTVMAAVPFHAFLGLALISTTAALAPDVYPSLDDQQRAGGLLWMSGELMSFVLAALVIRAWIAADGRAASRADATPTALDSPAPKATLPRTQNGAAWGCPESEHA